MAALSALSHSFDVMTGELDMVDLTSPTNTQANLDQSSGKRDTCIATRLGG
jgi:hypothetical protein